MNVKYTKTASSNLTNLPITNGQLIALTDSDGFYYDMENTRHSVSGVELVSSLPASGLSGKVYAVIENNKVSLYMWNGSQFIEAGGAVSIATVSTPGIVKPDGTTITVASDGTIAQNQVTLTQAEYDALPSSKLTDDVEYYISDGSGSKVYAEDVAFTNGYSVQDAFQMLTATLVTGQTSLTISNSRIHTTSAIDPYFEIGASSPSEPVSYSTIEVSEGSVTMTFEAFDHDVVIGIRVI